MYSGNPSEPLLAGVGVGCSSTGRFGSDIHHAGAVSCSDDSRMPITIWLVAVGPAMPSTLVNQETIRMAMSHSIHGWLRICDVFWK